MGRAQERQQRILEILSFRRSETMANIADELGVSIRTIRYDIDALTGSAPIYTVKGNGGSVRVADGWYLSKTYLCDEDEEMLRRMLPGLQPEDQKRMQHVLSVFAKPKVKEQRK